MRQVRNIPARGFRAAVLIVSVGACSSGAPTPTTVVGQPDQPRTQILRVDEAGISGQVQGRVIKVEVPISAGDRQASGGSLGVSLVEVGSTRTLAAQRAPFQVPARGSATVQVSLPVPPDIVERRTGPGSSCRWTARRLPGCA
jgi:hypothetical protein